jgi:tRNA (guanine37-N1)-methyltransferase
LNDGESALTDSFQDGMLGCPQYTRPSEYRGMTIPDVLLSGNHHEIDQWRMEQREQRTRRLRGDNSAS